MVFNTDFLNPAVRAWDLRTQTMIDSVVVSSDISLSKDYVLMTFIGRRDMSGKSVFEGDIVMYKMNLYFVKYDPFYSRFVIANGKVEKAFIHLTDEIIVMGDVYRHPNLTKQIWNTLEA